MNSSLNLTILLTLFLGDSILVHPVVRSGETEVSVYFPGEDTLWYEFETFNVYEGPGYQTLSVAIDKVFAFSIIKYVSSP